MEVSYKNIKGEVIKTTTVEESVDIKGLQNEKADLENKIAENNAVNKLHDERIKEIDDILNLVDK